MLGRNFNLKCDICFRLVKGSTKWNLGKVKKQEANPEYPSL